MMDIHKLIAIAPAWTDETWAARLDNCASALYLNGYITQSQRAKIADKMNSQFAKAVENGEIVERKL